MKKTAIKKAVESAKSRHMKSAINDVAKSEARSEVYDALAPAHAEEASTAPVEHGEKSGTRVVSVAEIDHRLYGHHKG